MSKVVWNTYFLVPPSSWLCGPRVATGHAPVSCCLPSGDHTLWPHGYSPLGDGLLRLLSLYYSCYYQQCNNTGSIRYDNMATYLFFLLFITELDDQVLVLCLLLCPLLVGGFKLVAQAFHLGRQFFIACCDPLNLVEALLSVPCGLH